MMHFAGCVREILFGQYDGSDGVHYVPYFVVTTGSTFRKRVLTSIRNIRIRAVPVS
jgi:hypothetical protein